MANTVFLWFQMLLLPAAAGIVYWRADFWSETFLRRLMAGFLSASATLSIIAILLPGADRGGAGIIATAVYIVLAVWVAYRYWRHLQPLGAGQQSLQATVFQSLLMFSAANIMIRTTRALGVLVGAALLFAAIWSRFGLLLRDSDGDG